MERFGLIALRTMVVKAVMTGLVLLLVREGGDALRYALLLAGATVVLNLTNFLKLRGLLPPLHMTIHGGFHHLKSILIFFVQTVAITIYTSMDTVMLGFMQNEYAVGVYDAGIKIKLLLSYFVTGMSAVLLPKLSYFAAKGRDEEAKSAISSTLSFTVLLSVFMIVFFGVMASETMELLCGIQVAQGENMLRFLLPTVFLIGCSSLVGNQILTPTHREELAMKAYLVGAAVNLGLNALFIPRWSIVGAAAATLISEACVLGTELWHLNREWKELWATVRWKVPLFAAVVPMPLLFVLQNRVAWLPAQFLLSGLVYGLCWLGTLYLMKEPLLMSFIHKKKEEEM